MATLKYAVDPAVFELAPDFVRGVVFAEQIDNSRADEHFPALLRAQISDAKTDHDRTVDDPRITAWESLYRQFPVPRGERIRPSHATLLRRIKKGDGERIPFISPLVAISNFIALKYMLPSGVFDIANIAGPLNLTTASGDEDFLPFGSEFPTRVLPGEIVLKDDGKHTVVCRAWNSKGGQASAISRYTQRAIIDVDCLSRIVHGDTLRQALDEAASLLSRFCGAAFRIHYLSITRPQVEL